MAFRQAHSELKSMETKELHVNEIRDYINRAPARCSFNGGQIVWNTHSRLKWLADICRGSIDDRINRRAGHVACYQPWKISASQKAVRRHRCNENRKNGIWLVNHW
jgi:hypothetical protein